MNTRRNIPLLFLFFLGWSIATSGPMAQTGRAVTVEWMHSRERAAIESVPEHTWLHDGTLLVYDRFGAGRDHIEKLNPKTGKRLPFIPVELLWDSLNASAGREVKISPWPLAFSTDGAMAIYVVQGDIFLVRTASLGVLRITDTPSQETAVRWSPDNRKLAFVRDRDLYVFDLDSRTERRLTFDGGETTLNGQLGWLYWEEIFDRVDLGYWWSPDSKSIAFLRTDESNVRVVHFQSFRDAVPQLTEQRYPKAGGVNPSVRLGIADVGDGTLQWVDTNGISYEYLIRVQWLPTGQTLSFQTLNRAQTGLDLYFFDRSTARSRHVLNETDSAWVNPNNDLYFSKKEKYFLWTSERDGYAHVYRYAMNGTLLNRVTSGAWCVRPSGQVDRSVVALDEQNDWVYFTSQERSHTERHLYRVRTDGSGMERLSKTPGTHQIEFSPDGRTYADVFSDFDTPPGLWIHAADGRLVQTALEPRTDRMSQLAIHTVRMTTIPAQDGFPLPARMVYPKDFDPRRRYPVILYTYSGPGAPIVENAWDRRYFWFHQILAEAGYMTVYVDNRSATGISKTLENLVLRRQVGDSELNDLVDAVRWLKTQAYVDSARVGIWGWSGGATATLLCMTRSREFKAGVAVAAVTDWKFYDTKYTETTMKTPDVNPDGYAATSLVSHARNLHGRLLLVHGSADDNVHPQNYLAFADELIRAGIPFDMMVYPGRDHSILDPPARKHLFNTMLTFWKERL